MASLSVLRWIMNKMWQIMTNPGHVHTDILPDSPRRTFRSHKFPPSPPPPSFIKLRDLYLKFSLILTWNSCRFSAFLFICHFIPVPFFFFSVSFPNKNLTTLYQLMQVLACFNRFKHFTSRVLILFTYVISFRRLHIISKRCASGFTLSWQHCGPWLLPSLTFSLNARN